MDWDLDTRKMKNNIPKTTLTLENGYGNYTVSVNYSDMSIDEVVDELVIPILLAAGYDKSIINEVLGRE